MIDAILGGERDHQVLAKVAEVESAGERGDRCEVVGRHNGRERLFTLRESLVAYRQCHQLIAYVTRRSIERWKPFPPKHSFGVRCGSSPPTALLMV